MQEELQKEIFASSESEAFVKVFREEHPGYVRGMGLGVTPSQILGSGSHSATYSSDVNVKIAKMQSEIDLLTTQVAEVDR